MGVYDQIRANAAKRDNYVNPAAVRRQYSNPEPANRQVRPVSARPVSVPAPAGGRGLPLDRVRQAAQSARTTDEDNGWSLGDGFGAVGKGIMGVLNVADAPRRAYQGLMGEFGDVVAGSVFGKNNVTKFLANAALGNPFQLRGLPGEDGERDTGFDIGAANPFSDENNMSQGFMGRTTWDDDLPGFLRPVVGIAGDLATDPLTYVTGGLAKAATKGVPAAGRLTLAKNVAEKVAAGDIAPEIGERLIREAGTRGRGALTSKGAARIGATKEDLARASLDPDFGIRVGVGGKNVKLPGTARVAESVENLKGTIKKATGASNPGRIARELFTDSKNGERMMKQAILSGAPDAATAARGLAVLQHARGESWRWLDETAKEIQHLKPEGGKPLRKFSSDEAKQITRALEAGDMSDPMVAQLNDFFTKVANDLQGMGVQFRTRKNYVPHRLSRKARAAMAAGDEDVTRYFKDVIDNPERFQMGRQSDETIAEINAKWRQNHDYDLLEDDMRILAAQYLSEGQAALLKARMTGDRARDLGLVTDMGRKVSDEKVAARLDELAEVEAENIAKSVSTRRQALRKTAKVARDRVAQSSKALDDLTSQATRADELAGEAAQNVATLERRLQVAEENARLLDGLASRARAAEKGAATRRLKEAQARRDELAERLAAARNKFDNAEKNQRLLKGQVEQARQAFTVADDQLAGATAARQALDEAPVAKEPAELTEAATNAAVKRAEAEEKFIEAESAAQTAAKTSQFLAADVNQVRQRHQQVVAEFDDWMARAERYKGRTKKGSPEMREQREFMREQLAMSQQLLREADDATTQAIAKIEAQAIQADAAAMMAGLERGRLGREFAEAKDLLSNPRFADMIVEQTKDGFERLKRQLGDDEQINSWYREALEFQRKIERNPNLVMRQIKRAVDAYESVFLQWWKGWALASPGFVLRNAYSGMFGMYLDNINPKDAGTFFRYLRRVEKSGVEDAKAWAAKTYGPERAAQLDEAMTAASATGWGITTGEIDRQLLGEGVSLNPFSTKQPFPKVMRKGGEYVEAALRGGHAYGVLRRGGNYAEAVDRVSKFHFNYRDISEFDRAAKKVMPFWTFFSRNLALQAEVYAKQPQKLTRSYFNVQRNIEAMGEDPGVPTPGYLIDDMMAIRTPFGGDEPMYFTPDIPSVRTISQFDDLLNTNDPIGGPLNELMAGAAPQIKIPYELISNRDAFLGREYRNDLTTYSDEGEVPRYAPGALQVLADVPGVGNALDALPGTEFMDGELLMQDNVAAAVQNLNPAINRLTRLAPNVGPARFEDYRTQRQGETFDQSLLSFLGGPFRWNDEGSQGGAIAAARKEAEEAARKVQERIRLEGLVREGRG